MTGPKIRHISRAKHMGERKGIPSLRELKALRSIAVAEGNVGEVNRITKLIQDGLKYLESKLK